jgi:hypothetical protein
MSIDAVAVLPLAEEMSDDRSMGPKAEGEWQEGEGPGGARGVFRKLADGTLLNLGHSFQAPDGELYELARSWMGSLPARIWIFPDTGVPEENTTSEVLAATRSVGRWVRASRTRREDFPDLGLTRAQVEAFRRETNSGDAKRVAAAMDELERHLQGRDPAEIEAKIAHFLASLQKGRR